MTGFAFEFFYLIQRKCVATFRNRIVAFGAGDVYMLSVKLESCIIVVEFSGFPVIC